jgi:hypothetical protein
VKIVALFPILIGLVLAALGAVKIQKAYDSETWKAAKGIIVSSKTIAGPKGGTRLQIEYDYGAYETAFHGKTIFFGDTLTTRNKRFIDRYLARYPMDKEVDVYYNPKDPKSSVLEPGIFRYVLADMLGGLSFIVLGIFLYIFLLIPKQPRRMTFLFGAFFLVMLAFILSTIWVMRAE